jgi:hypothetical protein
VTRKAFVLFARRLRSTGGPSVTPACLRIRQTGATSAAAVRKMRILFRPTTARFAVERLGCGPTTPEAKVLERKQQRLPTSWPQGFDSRFLWNRPESWRHCADGTSQCRSRLPERNGARGFKSRAAFEPIEPRTISGIFIAASADDLDVFSGSGFARWPRGIPKTDANYLELACEL